MEIRNTDRTQDISHRSDSPWATLSDQSLSSLRRLVGEVGPKSPTSPWQDDCSWVELGTLCHVCNTKAAAYRDWEPHKETWQNKANSVPNVRWGDDLGVHLRVGKGQGGRL